MEPKASRPYQRDFHRTSLGIHQQHDQLESFDRARIYHHRPQFKDVPPGDASYRPLTHQKRVLLNNTSPNHQMEFGQGIHLKIH
ncbi:unnamed protein product, partial [Arabidopsis halleri]